LFNPPAKTSQQFYEFVSRETGLIENAFEGSAFQVFSMKRNRHDTRPARMPKISMRSGAVINEKARAV
jgi:hypothetical protein